ncbi:MAG: hypothetical protein ACHQ50_13400, partial [Fimbriimonadales bacterium]
MSAYSNENWLRRIAIVAICGTIAVPIWSAARVLNTTIADEYHRSPGPTIATGAAGLLLVLWQSFVLAGLLGNWGPAPRIGRCSVVLNALVALVLGILALVISTGSLEPAFAGFFSIWLGQDYGGSFLAPVLLLVQWFALASLGEDRLVVRDRWRGVAIACVAYSAVLGGWTFVGPNFATGDEGRWRFFTSPEITFFNVGVAVHLIAIWQLVARSRFDWVWAGLIGFGCLVSGFIIAGPFRLGANGLDLPHRSEIGFFLYMGWYELAHFLPPIGYALTAIASVPLFLAWRERVRVARKLGQQTSSEGASLEGAGRPLDCESLLPLL